MKWQKPLIVLLFTLVILSGCSSPSAAPTATLSTATKVETRNVVIDTDMAADDWMAILYLLQREEIIVKAITVTGAGESHCEPGIRHALGLAALAGHDDVLVACGRETPLQGNHTFPESWRTGVDNLLGLNLPEGQGAASNQTAVELLASLIQASSDKITILTLGPLTNVAETLQKTPTLVNNIEMIYIMGGAVSVPGNLGGYIGANNKAEWNIYVDPFAASIVLQSGAPVTLVPLDATNHAPLTTQFYNRVKSSHTTPEATFVYDILTKQKAFIGSGGYYFWDPLAAAILTDESLTTLETRNLCVIEEEGPENGWTKEVDGCPAVRTAVSADKDRFEQIFLDALNSTTP